MSTSTILMTAAELLELPRGQYRYELINGELKTMSPSGHVHGRISAGDYQPKTKKNAEQWLRYGAQQVWLVNAKNQTGTIQRASGESRTFRSGEILEADDLLPGFRVAVGEILKSSQENA